jgi:prepilin-type N-terminal cleavage/methylation domain-containing protein/prepilin-type processing-associated H-X9-DG protein
MLPHAQGRSGFTLIELLVVIAIIAVLAGIIFPVFAQVREKARSATCQSNLKQVMHAQLMYAQDYDERMPWILNPQIALQNLPDHWWRGFWWYCLYPYTKNWKVFQCPSVSGYGRYGSPITGFSLDPDIPEGGMTVRVDFRGYGLNFFHIAGCQGATRSYAELREPARTIAYGDSAPNWQGEMGNDCGSIAWQDLVCPLCLGPGGCPVATKGFVANRHQGGANFGFADGHVKWYYRQWTLAGGGGGAIYEKDPAKEIWGHFTTPMPPPTGHCP